VFVRDIEIRSLRLNKLSLITTSIYSICPGEGGWMQSTEKSVRPINIWSFDEMLLSRQGVRIRSFIIIGQLLQLVMAISDN